MSGQREKYQQLIRLCQRLEPLTTAVAHPCDEVSLQSVVEAAKLGLIAPFLVGPRAKITAAAQAAQLDISAFELIDAPHSHAAAEVAAASGLTDQSHLTRAFTRRYGITSVRYQKQVARR